MLRLLPPINTNIPADRIPLEPTADRIIDRDELRWTKFIDIGWVPDGAGPTKAKSWEAIQVWGPFEIDNLNGELDEELL